MDAAAPKAGMSGNSLLELAGATLQFGGLTAVGDLSATVEEGSLTALIGPNGAGKTSVFNLITGVYQPTSGDLRFEGRSLVGLKPWQINRLGIARTFQNIRVFRSLNVFDNVRVAFHRHLQNHSVQSLMRLPAFHAEERQIEKDTLDLLDIFDCGALRRSRRQASRTATSGASKSSAPSRRGRGCCCWTSRQPA